MNELALFAGAGGGILGGKLLGWRTVCAVECERHAIAILSEKQNNGVLQPFPIWDDICTFDGKPWRGIIDVVSGGFPCQDISSGNTKATGIDGERSGLWSEMARVIREVEPDYVFVENSPMLTSRGLGRVLGDLAEMGYDARWGVLGAIHVGAPHRRERIWIVAHSRQRRCTWSSETQEREPDANAPQGYTFTSWWAPEPAMDRVAHGVALTVDRLERLGNGQVPAVAATAFRLLSKGI